MPLIAPTGTVGSTPNATGPATGGADAYYNNVQFNSPSGSSFTYGQQQAGNHYPAGIYGVGDNGSGTAVGTVQPEQLTSYQLNNLINENSPYIQQARLQAANAANARGALNSSIAAGNAQGAAIQAATPIAQQNANTYSNLQIDNLDNLNRVLQANIGAQAQVQSSGISAGAAVDAANINNTGALQRQREDLAYQGEQQGLTRAYNTGTLQQAYQNQLGLNAQGYMNQYGLNNQQGMLNYGLQSALSSQNYGQQLGLNQQGFGFQSNLSAQQARQNMQLGAFNLGGSLLQQQQAGVYNLGIQGLSNPALIGDPSSFGGYMQFLQGMSGNNIDNILNWAMNGLGG